MGGLQLLTGCISYIKTQIFLITNLWSETYHNNDRIHDLHKVTINQVKQAKVKKTGF